MSLNHIFRIANTKHNTTFSLCEMLSKLILIVPTNSHHSDHLHMKPQTHLQCLCNTPYNGMHSHLVLLIPEMHDLLRFLSNPHEKIAFCHLHSLQKGHTLGQNKSVTVLVQVIIYESP